MNSSISDAQNTKICEGLQTKHLCCQAGPLRSVTRLQTVMVQTLCSSYEPLHEEAGQASAVYVHVCVMYMLMFGWVCVLSEVLPQADGRVLFTMHHGKLGAWCYLKLCVFVLCVWAERERAAVSGWRIMSGCGCGRMRESLHGFSLFFCLFLLCVCSR